MMMIIIDNEATTAAATIMLLNTAHALNLLPDVDALPLLFT